MSRPPTFLELVDLLDGRLDETAAREVQQRVEDAGPETARTIAWIQKFKDDAGALRLPPVPERLSAQLRDLFPGFANPAATGDWSDAVLLSDTRDPAAAAGIRGATLTESAHLAYSSDAGRFLVEVSPAGRGAVDVRGLLMLDGDEQVDVALLAGGELQRATRARANGSFELLGLPATVDELWLTSGARRVRAELDLRGLGHA
jgi:hypothetical protein